MKAIMISIKPKYVAKILNGEKTIEVRRKFPKDYKGWVYLYCTLDYDMLTLVGNEWTLFRRKIRGLPSPHNGKVVARFYCDKVEELYNIYNRDTCDRKFQTKSLYYEELQKQSCVEDIEFEEYLLDRDGYAIHISNLEIFDNPKELGEFRRYGSWEENIKKCDTRYCDDFYTCESCVHSKLTKAPQSYCFIEVEE